MRPHVLQLDLQGTPCAWITLEQAATHYASGDVAWEEGGDLLATLHGGINARSGRQSTIDIAPIIALKGASRINLFDVVPSFSKEKLIRRDRSTCAYCGQAFPHTHLQCEHILPESRGGLLVWTNIVASCPSCNTRKRDRTPEEAGMPLLFLPYVPSRFEDFILSGRNIRADVHEWLAARLPKGSRLA
jgi:hypothetical protein